MRGILTEFEFMAMGREYRQRPPGAAARAPRRLHARY
jgi:hypothetical protein